MSKIITENYLLEKGFTKTGNTFGWAKFRKKSFELVEIPLKTNRLTNEIKYVIGFEYNYESQTKYKYPITESELSQLYKFLTNETL